MGSLTSGDIPRVVTRECRSSGVPGGYAPLVAALREARARRGAGLPRLAAPVGGERFAPPKVTPPWKCPVSVVE